MTTMIQNANLAARSESLELLALRDRLPSVHQTASVDQPLLFAKCPQAEVLKLRVLELRATPGSFT